MGNKIGVLGCGWLGFPLAKSLNDIGYVVRGATRSIKQYECIKKSAVSPFLLEVKEEEISGELDFFKELNVLIVALPPGIRNNPNRNFVQLVNTLSDAVSSSRIKRLIFISSTSVYGNPNGEVTELFPTLPVTKTGKQLLDCEKLLQSSPKFKTLVLRFGGLIGAGRHPIHQISEKKSIPNSNGYINFIHLRDCINMIQTALSYPNATGVYNGVCPYHPTRKFYYTEMAKLTALPLPPFSVSALAPKKISSQKFKRDFNYEFLVENLLTLK